MEDDYTGGDICIDGSTDCTGNDIVYGSRTDIHLKNKPRPSGRGLFSDSMFYLLEAFCHFAYFGIDFCSEVFYLHCSLFATTLLAH